MNKPEDIPQHNKGFIHIRAKANASKEAYPHKIRICFSLIDVNKVEHMICFWFKEQNLAKRAGEMTKVWVEPCPRACPRAG